MALSFFTDKCRGTHEKAARLALFYYRRFDGRSIGIEHLLFTEEGEPVAVWNPERPEGRGQTLKVVRLW